MNKDQLVANTNTEFTELLNATLSDPFNMQSMIQTIKEDPNGYIEQSKKLNAAIKFAKDHQILDLRLVDQSIFGNNNAFFFNFIIDEYHLDIYDLPRHVRETFETLNSYIGFFFRRVLSNDILTGLRNENANSEVLDMISGFHHVEIKKILEEPFYNIYRSDIEHSGNIYEDRGKKKKFEEEISRSKFPDPFVAVEEKTIKAVSDYFAVLTLAGYNLLSQTRFGEEITLSDYLLGTAFEKINKIKDQDNYHDDDDFDYLLVKAIVQLSDNYYNLVHFTKHLQFGLNHLDNVTKATTYTRSMALNQYFGNQFKSKCPISGVVGQGLLVEIIEEQFNSY